MEYENQVKIPKDRVAALIGTRGETKKKIEEKTGVKIQVNSKQGTATIVRTEDGDALLGIKAIDIVKAIASGFTPQKAFKLLEPNVYIEVINLEEHAKSLPRTKARVIGTEGKTRKKIEQTTGADVIIGEKHVAILGEEQGLRKAKEAILRLAEGSPHANVYRFLEKR